MLGNPSDAFHWQRFKGVKTQANQFRVAAGNGLLVVVYPNGGKYFVWKYRFPPGRIGQQRWHHIGAYGRGSGQWTLKAARDEKDRLDLMRKEGQDPRAVKADAKRAVEKQAVVPNLKAVAEDYLESSRNRQSTVNDYPNVLFNQVLPVLGEESPMNRTGSQKYPRVVEYKKFSQYSSPYTKISLNIVVPWTESYYPMPAEEFRCIHKQYLNLCHDDIDSIGWISIYNYRYDVDNVIEQALELAEKIWLARY